MGYLGLGNKFRGMIPKAQTTKLKNQQVGPHQTIKLQNLAICDNIDGP